jgi:L-2,4-diaminobutyrate decarboxylase
VSADASLATCAESASGRIVGMLEPLDPLPSGGPEALEAEVRRAFTPVLPTTGLGPASLEALIDYLPTHTVRPAHPHTVAHLHCPPDPVAVAADHLVAALNPSQDSWDQSAATAVIESCVIAEYSELAFGAPGAGSVTSGGTESTYLALLLARDAAISRAYGVDPAESGIPAAAADKLRILTSAVAHFSVARAAAQLGLGERSVVPVQVGPDHRLDPVALAGAAREIAEQGRTLIAVVGTAGTTDAGAIDPLEDCAKIAREYGAWFHADAAYGGGLLLSDVRRGMLAGIELADSAGVDLHKFGWQPIPAGLLLTRDPQALARISRRVAYLSDLDDEAAGYPNLLGRSLRTTRRADAVKILAAGRHHGRDGYTRMIESCFAQAAHTAAAIEARPEFELALRPRLTTVLFRYRARHRDPDLVNAEARRALLAAGRAVVGRTTLPGPDGRPGGPGALRLKLTLLRPETTAAELDALLDLVAATARGLDAPGG